MSSLQGMIIILSFLCLGSNAFFELRAYNSSIKWFERRIKTLDKSTVVVAKGSLIQVIPQAELDYPIILESVDFSSCRLPVKLTYNNTEKLHATSLSNGKVIIWLLNYHLTSSNKHESEWRFLLVEPKNCTYNSFIIDDTEPFLTDVVDVLGYKDSFHVLLTSLSNDEPRNIYVYGYNDVGERTSPTVDYIIPDVYSDPFYQPKTIKLYTVKKHDPADGYFFAQDLQKINQTVFKRLDASFNVLAIKIIEHPGFLDYSAENGNLTVCLHNIGSQIYTECIMMNSMLKMVVNLTTTHDSGFWDVSQRPFWNTRRILLQNFPNGNAMMLHVMLHEKSPLFTKLYISHMDRSSSKIVPVEFISAFWKLEDINVYQINEDDYCIVISCKEISVTQCIKIVRP